jgi:outer membrane protein assembly factor BamB
MCDCNNSLVGIISLAPAGTFDFEQKATEKDRLVVFKPDGTAAEAADARVAEPAKFEIGEADWPAYRRDNRRQSYSPVSIGAGGSRKAGLQLRWTYTPKSPGMPAAPITAGGLVLVSGADGAVRALDAATGTPRWTAYTSGPIKYPPAVWQGRVIAGSCDGCIYCFEAATGKSLWKFRAAPIERVIPVYGTLSSTWPVAGGVIVDDQVFGGGTIYAAAGIASYDGTHVYALDVATGRIRWQNNTSGRLVDKQGRVTGVSLQGHLLLHDDGKQGPRLYLAGGNVVSPAVYDARTGECLNGKIEEWQKGPRGRELFLVDGQVRVFDQLLYSPPDYQPSRYFSQGFFLQAGSEGTLVRAAQDRLVRLDAQKSTPTKPVALWQASDLADFAALAVTKNAVLATGKRTAGRISNPSEKPAAANKSDTQDTFVVAAYDLETGRTLWSGDLPAAPSSWGLAVDREGRAVVALRDGRVVCFQ